MEPDSSTKASLFLGVIGLERTNLDSYLMFENPTFNILWEFVLISL